VDDARAALVACIKDDIQLDQLSDDSLCHGWAGLVHTSRRMLADVEPDSLNRLEERWGHRRKHISPELSARTGMLEGSTGIALTDLPAGAAWDACLLTAPTGSYNLPTVTSAHTQGTG
jgi:hypothetical protein